MVAKKKGAGGNLTRSQIVTVRLDPKLKFAAELAARKQRRTISSYIEWAVEQSLGIVPISSEETVLEALWQTWNVEESVRVVKLAILYPQLLSYEEEQIWKLICECRHFWAMGYKPKDDNYTALEGSLYFDRVQDQWDTLHKIIENELPAKVLNDLPTDEPPMPEPIPF